MSVSSRLQAVRTILQHRSSSAPCTKVVFDVKRHYKVLSRICGVCLEGPLEDPKVADWMLDPDAKESPLHRLVNSFIPSELPLLQCKLLSLTLDMLEYRLSLLVYQECRSLTIRYNDALVTHCVSFLVHFVYVNLISVLFSFCLENMLILIRLSKFPPMLYLTEKLHSTA